MTPELAVLGNLLVDDIVFPDGRTRMAEPGGAATYAALAAALVGARAGIVSWRGDDYPQAALDALAARGVDLGGVHALGRDGVRTWLLYEGARRQVIHRLDRPTHAEVSPSDAEIPVAWAPARAFHLAPMPFHVQAGLVRALAPRAGAQLSLDPYVLLSPKTLPEIRALVAQVDALFLSEDEMELAEGRADPGPLLRSLCTGRLRLVAFKRGARGGLLYDARADRFHEWAAENVPVTDPTGAGDAFAGAFLASRLRGEECPGALRQGVAAASHAIGAWGLAGLLAAFDVPPQGR